MKKIYIVEDELLVALCYEHYFTKQGFEIAGPFTNAKDTLDSFSDDDCLIMLLDITLEDGMTGIEIAEIVRKKSNAPIVFTSGNDPKKTRERSKHLNNVYTFPKPVDLASVLEIINENS